MFQSNMDLRCTYFLALSASDRWAEGAFNRNDSDVARLNARGPLGAIASNIGQVTAILLLNSIGENDAGAVGLDVIVLELWAGNEKWSGLALEKWRGNFSRRLGRHAPGCLLTGL